MTKRPPVVVLLAFLYISIAHLAVAGTAIVTVHNPADLTRSSETIVLSANELRRRLAVNDVRKIHVRDDASGKELLIQAVDNNSDGIFDDFIFQTDIAANATKTFTLTAGARQSLDLWSGVAGGVCGWSSSLRGEAESPRRRPEHRPLRKHLRLPRCEAWRLGRCNRHQEESRI